MLARRNPAIRTMSSNLSTQVGSTLCCSVRCEEREDLSACPLWHRGHIHSAATLLSLLTVSPDSSWNLNRGGQKELQVGFTPSNLMTRSMPHANVRVWFCFLTHRRRPLFFFYYKWLIRYCHFKLFLKDCLHSKQPARIGTTRPPT